ncbi:MAG: protealysin inhibitor emfourin [Chloroflexota bacterium]
MFKVIPISLLLLSILVACAPSVTETPVPAAPLNTPPASAPGTSVPLLDTPPGQEDAVCALPKSWSLTFHRTGGFAGFDQRLTVNSQGELEIRSEQPPAVSSRTLSPEELAGLAAALIQACPFEAPADRAKCADCFTYELAIQWGDRDYRLQATDVNLPEALRSLTGALGQYFQETDQ